MVARGIVVRRFGESLRVGPSREDRSAGYGAAIRAPCCGSFGRTVNFRAHSLAAGQLSGARSTFGRTVNFRAHGLAAVQLSGARSTARRTVTMGPSAQRIESRTRDRAAIRAPCCGSFGRTVNFRAHGLAAGQLSGARSCGRSTFGRTVLRAGQLSGARLPRNRTPTPACLSWMNLRQGSPS